MPFERPTLSTLINRAISDIETRLAGADARLRRSFENVIARVVAGLAHGLHGHLVYVSRQLFPDTADGPYLRRWGSIWRKYPNDASFAQGTITITGVDTTSIPAGTIFVRTDGVEFETDETVAISGASITADVTAVESGADGNTDASTVLTIQTPITDIDADATVDGNGITGGADAEIDDDFRPRVLARIRQPPSGGGPDDYVQWTKEVSGVTRAWESGGQYGAGTVGLWFAVDGEISPIPGGAKVTEVQDYIDAVAPITADVTVSAPNASPLAFTIELTPDTAAVRAAVEDELEAYLLRAVDTLGTTLLISQMDEAISLAAGETNHIMTVPAADVVPSVGDLTTLGVITWV